MPALPSHLLEPVLTTEGMRLADRHAIEQLSLPGRLLMENAGRAAADIIEQQLGPASRRKVLVICGKGNNGGDGLVLARVLHARGARVQVAVIGSPDELTPDAIANWDAVSRIAEHSDDLEVAVVTSPERLNRFWPEWVIDALLGIGVTGPLRDPASGFARFINECEAPCVALDVPTGLDSDTGEAGDDTVRAKLTVTMGARKMGLLFRNGPGFAGDVQVADIGIPRFQLDAAVLSGHGGWLSSDRFVEQVVRPRQHGAHKYSAGRVFAIAGSRAYPGAAIMTALAAARSGAGAVLLAAPESIRPILETRLTEVMTLSVSETSAGTFAAGAEKLLVEHANGADAVIIGPGIGRDPETQALVRQLIPQIEKPLVIDADGLNALSDDTGVLREYRGTGLILTPHLGEMRRLVGGGELDEMRPFDMAVAWAQRFGCTLLLKGAPSAVGTPDGELYLSGATTSALASAGTGDVLTGVTCALLAQGLTAPAAALAALHISGRAAQRFTATHAPHTMIASDIINELPNVFPAWR
jgi:ADP-dependent NAD(P)H-hydrate dehydratase / NAD(P)H-hydrate epimerase